MMSNIIKLIIVFLVFIAIVFVSIFFLVPNIAGNSEKANSVIEERQKNQNLKSELERLVQIREGYNELKATNEKLSLQLPPEDDLSIVTNELYEIARISGVDIDSINYMKITPDRSGDKKKTAKESIIIFESNLNIKGSYYNILNFIHTLELMPRISIIEDIVLQAETADYENLDVLINFQSYYLK